MYKISVLILKLIGWEITGSIPPEIKKSIMIIAPHTSNKDFFIGRLAFWQLKLPVRFIIKKEFFIFPLGIIIKTLGGLPVNRAAGTGMINEVSEIIKTKEKIVITITPEGTRKLTRDWKKGYYFLAMKTKIPIVLGYLNYKDKKGGIGPVLYPTGDYEKDFEFITDFYKKNAYPRFPEKFNLSNILYTVLNLFFIFIIY